MKQRTIFFLLLISNSIISADIHRQVPSIMTSDTQFDNESTQDESEETSEEKKSIGGIPLHVLKVGLRSMTAGMVPGLAGLKDMMIDGIGKMSTINQLYEIKDQAAADQAYDLLKIDMHYRITRAIPGECAKGIAGEIGSQLLTENAYKQIIYKHLIYALADITTCKDKHMLHECMTSGLPLQVARGVTIEATSKALTDYIFDQLEKHGYDPFAISAENEKKEKETHMNPLIKPILKSFSKFIVHYLVAAYIVEPTCDNLIAWPGNSTKRCILSLDFGDL